MTRLREILSRQRERLVGRWRSLIGARRSLAEKPQALADLSEVMEQASFPTFSFYFMLALATAIATLGLLSNSAATIIGAMIIAPLMAPIISFAYGIVVVDWELIRRSIIAVASGTILVIALAFLSAELIGLNVVGSEILGRTAPTLLDLGVAMAAGCAAAFANTRRGIISSIAGVAIAVALVPPLAVVGIGMAFGRHGVTTGLSLTEMGSYSGEHAIAIGALSLFLANLAGIIVCAGAVFAFNGYGNWKKAALGLFVVAAASALLIHPLGASLHKLYLKSATLKLLATVYHRRPDIFRGELRIDSVNVGHRGDLLYVNLDVTGPRESVPRSQERVDLLRQYLTESLRQPVLVEVELTAIDLLKIESRPEAGEVQESAEGR